LLDAYIGVEFSVVYEVTVTFNKGGKALKASEKYYCAVPGAGVDIKNGRKDVPQDFIITPEGLEASASSNPSKAIPKFLFVG